ncbi:MAG: flavin reductase [Bacteroidales bacterium]|nr:flavin reductase [Bacteroidales bacterium]
MIPIDIDNLKESATNLIANKWMLITAGTKEKHNTMTASWGGIGHLWNKDVAYIFIRPHRYTYDFVEQNDFFSLSFFEEKYRDVLKLCGTKSGRDIDKMNLKITPIIDDENIFYNEAEIVMLCKKIYYQDIDFQNFLDNSIHKNYPLQDYHRMYIGEIYKTLKKK